VLTTVNLFGRQLTSCNVFLFDSQNSFTFFIAILITSLEKNLTQTLMFNLCCYEHPERVIAILGLVFSSTLERTPHDLCALCLVYGLGEHEQTDFL
jgi:hypothetical protein